MKSLLPLLLIAAALVVTAAPLPARGPLELVDFTLVGEWPEPMPYSHVAITGNYACVTCWHSNGIPALRVFDVSDPSSPLPAGEVYLPAEQVQEEVVVSGHYACVRFSYNSFHPLYSSNGGFHLIDISVPSHPVRTGTYASEMISAIEVHGPYVCIAYYSGAWGARDSAGFRVVDVSNPANPVPVGSCSVGEDNTRGMAIADNRACLIHVHSLVVVDLSNPRQPSVAGQYDFPVTGDGSFDPFPTDVAVAGNHAFVVTESGYESGEAGLEVIDIRDPSRPTLAGRSLLPQGGARVTVADNHAFVVPSNDDLLADYTPRGEEVYVYNVSDPAHPRRVDRGNFRGGYSSDALAKDHLFVPAAGIYQITKMSPALPALEMRRNPLTSAPDLWVNCPGYDDFTLTTSTSLTEWAPYATVFSRLGEFRVVPESSAMPKDPSRFYRASSAVVLPEEMFRKWKAVRPDDYIFQYERIESGGAKVISGIVEVEFRGSSSDMRIYEPRLNGKPLASWYPYQFDSVEGLFSLLNIIRSTADLVIVKWDPVLHYPAWIYFDPSAAIAGDEVIIRITDLHNTLVVVVPPPDLPPACKCLLPP